MVAVQKISPCLWFDHNAEEAAKYYTSIFKNSKIVNTNYFGESGYEIHGMKAGTVLTVTFELDGQRFLALNGGPVFKFNEAMSLVVNCENQDEVDYYWNKLTTGGDPSAQQCGWLKDKFGVSWQVVPTVLNDMLTDPKISDRVMAEVLKMGKIDLATIKRACGV